MAQRQSWEKRQKRPTKQTKKSKKDKSREEEPKARRNGKDHSLLTKEEQKIRRAKKEALCATTIKHKRDHSNQPQYNQTKKRPLKDHSNNIYKSENSPNNKVPWKPTEKTKAENQHIEMYQERTQRRARLQSFNPRFLEEEATKKPKNPEKKSHQTVQQEIL